MSTSSMPLAPYETDPAVRFTNSHHAADAAAGAAGGFRAPPVRRIITSSIDDTLTASAHMINLIIGREFGGGFSQGLHRPLRP